MPKVSPTQGAARLRQGIEQSGGRYMDGVNAVTENPAAKAAAASDKWFARLQEAHNNDRFAKGLQDVTLQGWKQAVAEVGQSRYTQGGVKAERNYQTFAAEFYPFLQQIEDNIATMPNMTIEDSVNRAATAIRALHSFRNR